MQKLSLQNKLTQDELNGLDELARIGVELKRHLFKLCSYPDIFRICSFCLGFYQFIDASEFRKFTQSALACLELGRAIPAIPDKIQHIKDDHKSGFEFVN